MADNLFAHPIKFARSLALTSTLLLPACSASSEPTTVERPAETSPSPEPQPPAQREAAQSNNPKTETSVATDVADAGDEQQDSGAFISGPLPPPELPASFV